MASDSNAATANFSGAACPTRGNHPYVDILAAYPDESFAKNPVGEAEKSAIDKTKVGHQRRAGRRSTARRAATAPAIAPSPD